jgi:DNA polymerase-3 subunit delta'
MNNTHHYPWHQKQAEHFARLIADNSLAHAMLFVGPAGVGKHDFARRLAAAMICERPDNHMHACGECKNCLLMQAETFPDFISISAEKNTISVDQVRELIQQLYLTRHFQAPKVAVIESAQQLNVNAANALLKTLEEPPEYTHLILIADSSLSLPATIRSRCQIETFHPPAEQTSLDWLNQQSADGQWESLLRVAQGAPLKALQYHETDLLDQRITAMRSFLSIFEYDADPMRVAKTLEAIPFVHASAWLQSIILDLLRIKAQDNPTSLENPDFYRPLLALANKIPVACVNNFWQELLEQKKIFDVSLNYRMFLEVLLISIHKQSLKAFKS